MMVAKTTIKIVMVRMPMIATVMCNRYEHYTDDDRRILLLDIAITVLQHLWLVSTTSGIASRTARTATAKGAHTWLLQFGSRRVSRAES